MDRPLSDIRVLDLTRALAGPIAARLLADLGAEVIKVEPPDGDLTRLLIPKVDGASAYYAQYNVGKRCVSIDRAEATLVVNDLASSDLTGQDPDVGFRPGQNWSPIFTLANGRHVSVTLSTTNVGGFEMWIKAMGRPELADDPRFATVEDRTRHEEELETEIAGWVATFDSAAELEAALPHSGVLAAEVRTVQELADTEWAAERGAFVDVDTGRGETVTVPQAPWRFSEADSGVNPVIGYRGEHNREVLRDLAGATDDEIDALMADGVVSDRPPRWAG